MLFYFRCPAIYFYQLSFKHFFFHYFTSFLTKMFFNIAAVTIKS